MSSIIRIISLTLLLGLVSACANTETGKKIPSERESAEERTENIKLGTEILMHVPDEILVNYYKKLLSQDQESLEKNKKEIVKEMLKHYDHKLKFNYSKEEIAQIIIRYVVSSAKSKEKSESLKVLNFINEASVADAAKLIRIFIAEVK